LNEDQVLEVDAVVLAEGLYASSREQLYPSALKPQFTGQACWRVVLPRPPEIDHRFFFLGGSVKVGLTPVSKDQMYLFLLESIPDNPKRAREDLPGLLLDLLAEFEGPLRDIKGFLDASSPIVYRPLESHLLRSPWYQGAVVLVGDAAHATTPQLASGAGMAMEDAIVLSEEFMRSDHISLGFQSYFERRFERCRMVVENSLKIGELEQARASAMVQAQWVERSLEILAQPY
jgi:2-polyprenyl-6-methoxyphenol hydroxylase-like FAD-dependent oxidoreductase